MNFAAPTDQDPGVRPERGIFSPIDLVAFRRPTPTGWHLRRCRFRTQDGIRKFRNEPVLVFGHRQVTCSPEYLFALLSFACFTFPVCVFQVDTMAKRRGRLASKGVCLSLRL
jgi:hypothetical protein